MESFFISTIGFSLFSFFTYFTTFPKNLYIYASKNSHSNLISIGYKLINIQRMFWFSNISCFIIIYNSNAKSNKIYFLLPYFSLQFFLFYKNIKMYKLLKENVNY